MSQWGYYSPAFLGAAAVLVYAIFGRGDFTQSERALIAAIGAPAAALAAQILMLAVQGIFAGVLPAPKGKTLRGRKCPVIGFFVLIGGCALAAGWLAYRSGTQRVALGAAIAGAVCWLSALGLYGWSLPTATADFGPAE